MEVVGSRSQSGKIYENHHKIASTDIFLVVHRVYSAYIVECC